MAAACSGGAPPVARHSPSPAVSLAPASPPACVTPAAPALSQALSSIDPVLVLASGLNQPDDVFQDDASRRLLIGEMGSGRIVELGQNGRVVLAGHVNGVEGLVVLDHVLYAADQPDDRVVSVGADGTVRTLIQLSPVSGVEGVDGIASGGGLLIVPDAARGRVLWVRPDGTVTRTVGGFSRPAGAWGLPDGSVLIADENLGGVFRVAPDGSRTRLGGPLPEADDVVQDGQGNVYAVAVYVRGDLLVKLVAGAWQTVASGAWEPQGLAVDVAGNPIVTDPLSGRVYAVVAASKLVAPGDPIAVPRGEGVCLRLVGGGGEVEAGPGYQVAGPLEVVPEACAGTCSVWVQARAGSYVTGVWLRYTSS